MASRLDQVEIVGMNPYFKPRTPEPKTGALDIVIRLLACAVVVLALGVGIWLAQDATHKDTRSDKPAEIGWHGASNSNVVVHVPDTPH